MDDYELAKQIVINLNIAYGRNLPKDAVDVVVATMRESESSLTMRDTDATVCDCPQVNGVVYHVVGCSTGFFNSLRRIR